MSDPSVFSKDLIGPIISGVGIVLSFVFSCFSLYFTWKTRSEVRQNSRPFFIIEDPGFKATNALGKFIISIPFKNTGGRPASEFSVKMFIVEDLKKGPIFSSEFEVSNDIPPNSPTPYHHDVHSLPENMGKFLIIILVKYKDVFLNKFQNQEIYMRFNGITNGNFSPNFVHATIEESNNLKIYIRKILKMLIQ